MNNYNIKFNNNYKNNYIHNYNGNDEYNQVNKLLAGSLNNFLENENYEPWIKALNQIQQKMYNLNDNNGFNYIEFNKLLIICLQNENENNYQNNEEFQNNNELNEAKMKLNILFQTLNENQGIEMNEKDITDEYINDLILDYKLKLKSIKNIYHMLYSFEEKLNGKIKSQEYHPNNCSNII